MHAHTFTHAHTHAYTHSRTNTPTPTNIRKDRKKELVLFDINDNFWQHISVFMFQGECTVNLNNLFSQPSTPILTWTNPRQSFLGNYDYASHFTYDNSSVSVHFHFLDLHLPSSASVWSVLFGFSTM